MAVTQGLGWTFDTVAEAYDRWNPTYVPELYADIFAFQPIDPSSKALEVGIGTGLATEPILRTGCDVTAVELGEKLAAYTRQKFQAYGNLNVVNLPFESYACAENTYDLVYSARAFHWIPEEIGYRNVCRFLKPGGTFARFANHPYKDKGREDLDVAIQAIYTKYMPGSIRSAEYDAAAAKERAEIALRYGFSDIDWKLYHRTRTFSGEDYTGLLGTYSDHIALPEEARRRMFFEVREAIEKAGNEITIYDTLSLQLARK